MFYHPSHSHGLARPTLIDLLGSRLALAHVAPAICLQAVLCIYSQHFCGKTFFPSGLIAAASSVMSVLREAFTSLSLLYPLIFLCDSYAFLTLVLIGVSPLEGSFVGEGLVCAHCGAVGARKVSGR